ncbi:MAG: SGNH/GDSL hydrolase family protein [Phycisphaerales bacterium]|nr:SGNH/GDSL hydrolase family protein [Phycisphaerales bacterium]
MSPNVSRLCRWQIILVLVSMLTSTIAGGSPSSRFFLQPHDRVVFYGDSITEQRLYTNDVATFVHTRFPKLPVTFINSGVGGDKVGGGWAGPLNVRLARDVFPFRPTVVVVMLGMNDVLRGHPLSAYEQGYQLLVAKLKKHLPHVRLVLIGPSPFGDSATPNKINDRLIVMSRFVQRLAKQNGGLFVDFNAPLVSAMARIGQTSPKLASKLIPGKIHPGASGQLLMATALLKAWHAPSTVTAVQIQARPLATIRSDHTTISLLSRHAGRLTWTQQDTALPFPIMNLHAHCPQFPPISRTWTINSLVIELPYSGPPQLAAFTNPLAQQVLRITHFYRTLDAQTLMVNGLNAGNYTLRINNSIVGTFTQGQLAAGINLAKYNTPMLQQAYRTLRQVWRISSMRYFAWRQLELTLYASTANQTQTYVASPWVHVKPGRIDNTSAAQRAVKQILAGYSKLVHLQQLRLFHMMPALPTHYELSPAAGPNAHSGGK